jgi:TPR repeat protein
LQVALLVGLLGAGQVLAAPADDFQRGRLAYQRGDVVGAMAALRPAAAAGYAPAQSLLAFILDRADLGDEALLLLRAAAAQDDADAHAGLADRYLSGRGVAKDEKQALLHFSKAAALGHAKSIEVIADGWLHGRFGLDAASDPAAARSDVLRAAQRQHLPSADAVAAAYRSGRFGLPVDEAEAARWQLRAATWRQQRSETTAKASK